MNASPEKSPRIAQAPRSPASTFTQPPGDAARIEVCGKIARTFGACCGGKSRPVSSGDGPSMSCLDVCVIVDRALLRPGLPLRRRRAGADVNVVGLFPGKAVVSIDGGAPRDADGGPEDRRGRDSGLDRPRYGDASTSTARSKTLRIGQHQCAAAAASSAQSVTLTADSRGHFVIDGQINGGPVRFLVDTGATIDRAVRRRTRSAWASITARDSAA